MKAHDRVSGTLQKLFTYFLVLGALSFVGNQALELHDIQQRKQERADKKRAEAIKQSEIQERIAALKAETFEDYMIYYGMFPPKKKVLHGSKVYMVSDSEVKKTGFNIMWRETMLCDNNPYDNDPTFEYYASVMSTSAYQAKVRERHSEQELSTKKGWPVREWREDPEGKTPIIRYPDHDADCKLRSVMIQAHVDEIGGLHYKELIMFSEVVEVRGVVD